MTAGGSDGRCPLRGRVIERTLLRPDQLRAMEALLAEHFEGVAPAVFRADLAQKDRVVWVEDERGALQGFTTFAVTATRVDDRRARVLYSGDTIVRPSARSSTALARAWIDAVERVRLERPGERLFWLLIVSGFRTYRFLPVFWHAFWPRWDEPTPLRKARLLEQLARERFGERFDQGTGLVQLASPQPLRDADAGIPAGRASDPHVAFFLERNPGWRAGQELVCLTELSTDNLTRAGRRMLRAVAMERSA